MMNATLEPYGTTSSMRDTSALWSLPAYIGNDDDVNNGSTGTTLHETCYLYAEGPTSVSAPSVDHGDASTDETSIRSLSDDDSNMDDNADKESAGRMSQLPWLAVTPCNETPLRYNRELKIEDEEGDTVGRLLSSAIASGATTIAAHTKHICGTQLHGCASVRVGWDSQIPRWCRDSELSYVVCEESFLTKDSAMLVEAAMRTAISAWKDIGVRFKQAKRHEPATFAVIYDDIQRDGVYAYSFFPKASPGELLVCPLSFSGHNKKHLSNVFSHEVGHILGLRHEFAHDKEAKYPSVRFGSEDPRSVMKYYKDLSELRVSEQDLEGLKEFYAYDQPVYKGLSVIDIFPMLDTFSERSGTNHATKKPSRRFSC